jgi:hypothetical protein
MADITMCVNSACHARSYCYRQQAKPHPKRQSMSSFTPKNNVIGEGFECENFYSMHENWFKKQDAKTK